MKTIIIDDEELARKRLNRLLKDYDFFEIIGEANNGLEGLELIEKLRPDVIFLDIEMPEMNGFEMLSKLEFMPLVVFATAFNEFAIKAFEENSIDYLLKPVERERLELTIRKLEKWQQNQPANYQPQFLEILEKFKPKKELHSIPIKVGDKILLVKLDEVTYFEAEEKYVFLYQNDGKKHLTDYTLTNLAEKLPADFVRVSRSVILNKSYIREIQKHFNGRFQFIMPHNAKLLSGSTYGDVVKVLIEF